MEHHCVRWSLTQQESSPAFWQVLFLILPILRTSNVWWRNQCSGQLLNHVTSTNSIRIAHKYRKYRKKVLKELLIRKMFHGDIRDMNRCFGSQGIYRLQQNYTHIYLLHNGRTLMKVVSSSRLCLTIMWKGFLENICGGISAASF